MVPKIMIDGLNTNDAREQILQTAQGIISGKGFSAVGLNEILAAARIPKGSFYHYFQSKDAFGEALLERYFEGYLSTLDTILELPGLSGAERLMGYWERWIKTQVGCDPQGKCLAVKLGAEVSDLSESMRLVLDRGTKMVMLRLSRAVAAGVKDGSIKIDGDPLCIAEALYQTWLGASLLAKITREVKPLEAAMAFTRRSLGLKPMT